MTIAVGDRLPDVGLLRTGENGPEEVRLADLTAGRKVVIFGLPGAFTKTCSAAHVPSFIRVRQALTEAGVDEVICIAVNDPAVMHAWAEATGGDKGGITMLGDPASDYTKGVGLAFTAPVAGFYDRTVRHSLYAEDGVVTLLHVEEERGVCNATAGETMLEAIKAR